MERRFEALDHLIDLAGTPLKYRLLNELASSKILLIIGEMGAGKTTLEGQIKKAAEDTGLYKVISGSYDAAVEACEGRLGHRSQWQDEQRLCVSNYYYDFLTAIRDRYVYTNSQHNSHFGSRQPRILANVVAIGSLDFGKSAFEKIVKEWDNFFVIGLVADPLVQSRAIEVREVVRKAYKESRYEEIPGIVSGYNIVPEVLEFESRDFSKYPKQKLRRLGKSIGFAIYKMGGPEGVKNMRDDVARLAIDAYRKGEVNDKRINNVVLPRSSELWYSQNPSYNAGYYYRLKAAYLEAYFKQLGIVDEEGKSDNAVVATVEFTEEPIHWYSGVHR